MVRRGDGELGKSEDRLGSVAVSCLQIFTKRCGYS